jgi:hypothetical protein
MQVELLITTQMTELNNERIPNDIFDMMSGTIDATEKSPSELPSKIYYNVTGAEANAGRYVTLPMVKELSAAPGSLGSNGDLRLNEEDIITKSTTLYYNDLGHGTTNQKYGILARDKFPYQVFEQRVPLLKRWSQQYFGRMRRQALLERISENLEEAPHYLTAMWSPNWFIPNRSFAQQPAYKMNASNWTDALVDALTSAGTGINACGNIQYFQMLNEWARDEKFIAPLQFENGKTGYYATVPTPTMRWLRHIVQNGNTGAVLRDLANQQSVDNVKVPNWEIEIAGIRLVDDQRYPTLTVGGTKSNSHSFASDSYPDYTMTAQYRGQGNADDGSSDPRDKTASSRMVGYLLGEGALAEWMPEAWHWEWEYEMYDRFFGSGIFCGVGIQQIIYDVTAASRSNDSVQQFGSIVLPFAQPPISNPYSTVTA